MAPGTVAARDSPGCPAPPPGQSANTAHRCAACGQVLTGYSLSLCFDHDRAAAHSQSLQCNSAVREQKKVGAAKASATHI